jgi:hypothetical protein
MMRSRKEDTNIVMTIRNVMYKQDAWIQCYNELKNRLEDELNDGVYKEENLHHFRTARIVFNMIASTFNADKKNNTQNAGTLVCRLFDTNLGDLKLICYISTFQIDFEKSMDALEAMKDEMKSGEYVRDADHIKYLYDLHQKACE